MRHLVETLLLDRFFEVAEEIYPPLLEVLSLVRRHCNGDLDTFVILLLVAARSVRHQEFKRSNLDEVLSQEFGTIPGYGTNIRSIAESMSMPRESVRRRVNDLLLRGWLIRDRRKLYLTSLGFRELQPIGGCVVTLVSRNYLTVSKLIDATDS